MQNPPIVSPYSFPGMKNFYYPRRTFEKDTYKSYIEAKQIILEIIAKEFGIRPECIISNCRKREYTDARHVYCTVVRLKYNVTLTQIGKDINNRDHTSVRHAILKFRDRYKTEDSFRYVCNKIFNAVKVTYHGEKILGGEIR